jgi:hypothetical protein
MKRVGGFLGGQIGLDKVCYGKSTQPEGFLARFGAADRLILFLLAIWECDWGVVQPRSPPVISSHSFSKDPCAGGLLARPH